MVLLKVLGINLSPDESAPSGMAQLEDNRIRTFTVYKDAEILEIISRFSPKVVVLDVPVFVPEEDFRPAEKEMQQLGYEVSPVGYGKTVKTANRASHFRHEFEGDITFVETKTDIAKKELGISDIKELKNVKILNIIKNDLERNAVVCAVVGAFFLENNYSEFGEAESGKVILPKLE